MYHAYLLLIQLALNKTFCPTPPPFIHRQLKHRRRTKLTEQCFLPPPHRFSTQSSQYQNWKAKKYSFLTVIEPGLPVSESSTWTRDIMPPTDSEHKFHETGVKNWLLIGFNRWSSWLGTRRHNHYTMFNH